MDFKPSISRWAAVAAGAVVLAGVLAACGAPVGTTQDVAGARSNQAAGTPSGGAAPVPTSVTQGVQSLYNVNSFFGEANVTVNTNALRTVAGVTPAAGSATPGPTSTGGGTNQVTMTIDQWFMQPNSMKLVVKSASDPSWNNSQLVYDGKTLSYYTAATNQAIQIQDRAQTVLFLNMPEVQVLPQIQMFLLQQTLQNVSTNVQISQGGTATVAGRSTTEQIITPQGSSRIQTINVWRDDQTGAPLRVQVMDTSGNTVLNIEYTTFDPSASVSSNTFTFSPPSGATLVQPAPSTIAKLAGFNSTDLQTAQSSAGFQLYQITQLPSGISQQSVQQASFDNSNVVAILYGTGSNDISTSLIEKPSSLQLPFVEGGQRVSSGGTTFTLYQDDRMVVVDWTQGTTDLTLATTESASQAISMAQSVQPVGAPAGATPAASPGAASPVASPSALTPAASPTTVPGVAPATPPAPPSTASPAAATPATPRAVTPVATPATVVAPTSAATSGVIGTATPAPALVTATPTSGAPVLVPATPTSGAPSGAMPTPTP